MINSKLSNIITLIISERFDADALSEISNADWHMVFEFAKSQNIHLLIYKNLKNSHVSFPETICDRLEEDYYVACAQDFRRKKQLKEIITIFNIGGIDCILLKGAHLLSDIYEKSAFRRMSDIDILVKEKQADTAYELLIANGYVSTVRNYKALKKGFDHHYPQLVKTQSLPVEIHTRLSTDYKVNMENIWKRSQSFRVGNQKTRLMCVEDLIMHTAFHKLLVDCSLNGIMGLYDIGAIIDKRKVDWKKLEKLARTDEWNNTKCLFLALYLLKKFTISDVDTHVMNSIRPDFFTAEIEKTALQVLFADNRKFDISAYNLYETYKRPHGVSSFLKKVFLSPEKMAMYGNALYGKGNLTVKNLIQLYIKRTYKKLREYNFALFIRVLTKKKSNEAIKISRNCARLKEWLHTG